MAERKQKQRIDENTKDQLGAGGGGSNDVDSGGGAGSGIPDAETVDRAGEQLNRGDPKKDKEKIFPEAGAKKTPGSTQP